MTSELIQFNHLSCHSIVQQDWEPELFNESQLGEVQMTPPCIYLQCGKSENLLYQPTKHFTSINQRVKEAHDIIKKSKEKAAPPFHLLSQMVWEEVCTKH